jgi:ubiquinone/menaquinone biosynthesis C-methylase UbiE/catechol 2,3-dioxygenase-like lactoylglutathione lyase family enzyme
MFHQVKLIKRCLNCIYPLIGECEHDMSFKFIGIDHIQLAAPKGCEAAARRFYGETLGWDEITKPEKLLHRGGVWFHYGLHEVHIGVQADFLPATKAHPGLYVENLADWRAHLIHKGLTIIEDELRAEEGVIRLYINDPFGNRLEFLERVATNHAECTANSTDHTARFTNRVDDYVKYRPSYPTAAIDYLYNSIGLHEQAVIADIGAGTGILTRLLLARGGKVIGIEPNQAMREAAEQQSAGDPNVRFVLGTAESTGLPDQSIDYIVCAQAFHWFDRNATQSEFRRILKPGGKVILIWNTRITSGSPFREQYEQLLLSYGIDYINVKHTNITKDTLGSFYRKDELHEEKFYLNQWFDLEGLTGRLLSSSYSPVEGHPNYVPMMMELARIFERNQRNGEVSFDYETQVFWGEL